MTKSLKTERSSIIGVERVGFVNVLLIPAHFGSWRARSTLTLGLPRYRITAIWGQSVYSIVIFYRREERDDVIVNKTCRLGNTNQYSRFCSVFSNNSISLSCPVTDNLMDDVSDKLGNA